MNLNEYQQQAKTTAEYETIGAHFMYPLLGLAGEAGEVVEKFKKMFRNDDGVMTEEFKLGVKKELGDVLWYIAILADELGIELEDVAEFNVEKLRSRKERGVIKSSGDDR